MAVLRAVKNQKQSSGSMFGVMIYMADKEKTTYENRRLTTGLNCNFNNSFAEMQLTKEQFKKTDKRQFYQFVQSFAEDDKVTSLEIHEMGLELAQELFLQFEVIVATHTNTENLHNHILVNSVSFNTGKKLHQNHDTFTWKRQKNDEICVRHGLSVLQKYQKMKRGTAISSAEYNAAKRGKSWKFKLMATIDDCMKFARNKKRFIDLMESEGYKVNWTDARKYIAYTTQEGNKCRDNKLHENKYLKENMENEFRIREEKSFARVETIEQTRTFAEDTAELQRGNTVSDGQYYGTVNIPEQNYANDISITAEDVRADEADVTSIFVGGTEQETGEDLRPVDAGEQESITGWEEEILELFTPKTQTTEDRNISTYNDFDNGSIADIGSDLVQIGASIERLGNAEPVIDSTTQPTTKISRKHRHGEKEDHKRNFEMKM